MITDFSRHLKVNFRATALLAGLTMAACAPIDIPPQQVQSHNPSVTYKYRGDQELVQANQNASVFCNRYQAVPQTANFSTDPDSTKIVVFDCVQPAPVSSVLPVMNSNLTYNYRTDQDLLDTSRNAQAYCMNSGSPQVMSNIITNPNGTKTIMFQCGPR